MGQNDDPMVRSRRDPSLPRAQRTPRLVSTRPPRAPRRLAVDGPGDLDRGDPSLYLNRELSWLDFNERVLAEARDPSNPLLERLKFISIFGSNLDEFFMKRIGGLKQQVASQLREVSPDGRTPRQQLEAIEARVRPLVAEQHRVYAEELLPGAR